MYYYYYQRFWRRVFFLSFWMAGSPPPLDACARARRALFCFCSALASFLFATESTPSLDALPHPSTSHTEQSKPPRRRGGDKAVCTRLCPLLVHRSGPRAPPPPSSPPPPPRGSPDAMRGGGAQQLARGLLGLAARGERQRRKEAQEREREERGCGRDNPPSHRLRRSAATSRGLLAAAIAHRSGFAWSFPATRAAWVGESDPEHTSSGGQGGLSHLASP
jgi:hypothetical protein